MKKPRKILIIKTGFTEFLDRGISTTVSLGDVLICTSLLRLYKDDHVTWVGSRPAYRLLKDNPLIKELKILDSKTFLDFQNKEFDILINLEKDIGICIYLNQIKADKRFGFYFSDEIYDIVTYNPSAQYLLAGQENQRNINSNAYEILFETVDAVWDGEGALLYRAQRKPEICDIGFNFSVGSKWPTKAWPLEKWQRLENLLNNQFSLSWQKGFDDLDQYIDWIDSCRLIITSDSLGQILAQAMGKKVITLYGSTNHIRMQRVPNIHLVVSPSKCPHRSCYLPVCKNDSFCMDEIVEEQVVLECQKILKENFTQKENYEYQSIS